MADKSEKIASDIQTITSDVAQSADAIVKANPWTALLGFMTALPGIVNLIQRFMNAVGNDPQKFIAKAGVVFDQLEKAQTPKEKQDAANSIAVITDNLPS